MTRSLRVLSGLAILALVTPAAAQVTTRDHRNPPDRPADRPNENVGLRMEVTSWAPKAGKPGTLVTLDGRAFTRSTTILVGGRPVAATITSSKITFKLPELYGNGEIRLRKPNVADDYVVGTIVVEVAPAITAIAPPSGPAGTRVEIRGKGFAKGDELRMNGRALATAEWADARLVVVIPDWAKTDHLALYRGGAEQARSRRPFVVIAPAPVVAGFTPEGGPPGTTVRISGQAFAPDDKLLYGNRAIAAVGRGNGWVDVKLADGERRSERFQVVGAGGRSQSASAFRLELPPVVGQLRPTYGAPGSQFSIAGQGFQAGDLVALGGKRVDVVQLKPDLIVGTVPHGTPGGDVVVKRGEAEYKARDRFDVVNAPTLTGFAPTKGEPGTKVTLTGTWLAGATVWYGAARVNQTRADDKSIDLVIPPGATDQKFLVKTRGGEVTSDRAFQVLVYGTITDARPRRVAPGGTLTLHGANLDQIDKVYLAGLELPIALKQDRTATVTVPVNAHDGKLGWLSHGRRAETTWDLKVLQPPSIAGFQPDAGPPGTTIIVRGANFDEGTRISLGDQPLRIVKRSPTELSCAIDGRARGKDYLWVQGEGARVRSATQFAVLVAPEIREVTPAHGAPGAQLSVRGTGFDPGTEILIGAWRTTVVKRGNDIVYVTIPPGATPGSWDMTAKSGALSSTWRKKFTVDAPPPPPAAITGFSPRSVEHGGTVEISGTGFTDGCRILVTGKELPITRRDPAGLKLWVTVPSSVKGEHWIDLVDGNRRSKSADKLTIVEPAGGVKVRDHRTKDAPKGGVDVRDHRRGGKKGGY